MTTTELIEKLQKFEETHGVANVMEMVTSPSVNTDWEHRIELCLINIDPEDNDYGERSIIMKRTK